MNKEDKDMEAEVFADKMKQQLTEYLQLRLDLLKADFTEKTALIVSRLITAVLVLAMVCMVVLFASLVMGFYFSELLGSRVLGFSVVVGFYIVLIILLLLLKNRFIQQPVANQIIDVMYESEE